MEAAIKTVVSVYLKSAKGKENLGAKDFQSLVKSQLKNIMTDTDSSEAVKQMRQGLDSNQDGKVSFKEYMTLVGYLAESLSQQRCSEETQAASSVEETQVEASAAAAANTEPEEEVAANVKDEAEEAEEEEEKAEEEETS